MGIDSQVASRETGVWVNYSARVHWIFIYNTKALIKGSFDMLKQPWAHTWAVIFQALKNNFYFISQIRFKKHCLKLNHIFLTASLLPHTIVMVFFLNLAHF